ncbi:MULTISPECIES: N-6 DNA methylase [unclassified Dehalobacter]|uniref:N-6 DNA methylase n=1 Tax=unclassified Dehalobacter TaxID=2635733 RepID=UPI000E6BE138|nr:MULTISPECIES: N-6 DNA methylase [unclassified Dehalobacter]RJE49234.1 restriction endonuclease subunit M [Dehalobacter sp. MCB1]TCX53279.1 restriction endonuclease subunit M [Dehalobacter sp. 14DCB1]TCX54293.1 restriction endonuclease subunit M [Dehalobacter sp. 12DCB1]
MDNHRIDSKLTAEILGISVPSVRNWIRHGYLHPSDPDGKVFDLDEVFLLRERIAQGDFDRLRKRANKAGADKRFAPTEYILNKRTRKQIMDLLAYLIRHNIDRGWTVFVLALNLFRSSGDILSDDLKKIIDLPEAIFQRQHVRMELKNFYQDMLRTSKQSSLESSLKFSYGRPDSQHLEYLFNIRFPLEEDILGIIYQSLTMEGNKARLGSYFTPPGIANDAARAYIRSGQKVLDPCCGTGQYLLSFARNMDEPENIYGMDLDLTSVRIARFNLLLTCSRDFHPNIIHCNTLTDMERESSAFGKFDFIATNPPWGAEIDLSVRQKMAVEFPEITSGESFSYFLRVSLDLMKDGGVVSFILPESILNIRAHADIRGYLLENCQIIRIEYLGRRFKNVFSAVIRLDLRKALPSEKDQVLVKFPEQEYLVSQERFRSNAWHIFDIYLSSQDEAIFSKVYSTRHTFLKDKADWALGIVTGDNRRYLLQTNEPGAEPIYKGSDVDKFVLKKPSSFLRFQPDKFQQTAPEHKYRTAEKLIYRFISERLVFAYDDQGSLTLNSANILIPEPGNYPVKVILALFNSSLYQFLFRKKFHTLKVLRGDLELLPLPLWEQAVIDHILQLTNQIIVGEDQFEILDQFIMEQFRLTPEERRHIRDFSANTFSASE